jgi:hypothetical protein
MIDVGSVLIQTVVVGGAVANDVSMHDLPMFVGMDVLKRQQPGQGNRESGHGRDDSKGGD